MKVHSHYENLRVARNAPPEVIRAAYRALCQLHHPDLNSNEEESNRKLTIINRAYRTLIDSEKRRLHDAWIEDQEWEPDEDEMEVEEFQQQPELGRQESSSKTAWGGKVDWIWYQKRALLWIALVTGAMVMANTYLANDGPRETSSIPSFETKYVTNPISPTPALVTESKQHISSGASTARRKLKFAPNGDDWPTRTQYMDGYPILHRNGNSTIRINNTNGIEAWHVKLVSVEDDGSYAVRNLFIDSESEFVFKDVLRGSYELRFRSMSGGTSWKTPVYQIKEDFREDRMEFTRLSLTIFRITNGNLKRIPIRPEEF